jgi:hypothetical protein
VGNSEFIGVRNSKQFAYQIDGIHHFHMFDNHDNIKRALSRILCAWNNPLTVHDHTPPDADDPTTRVVPSANRVRELVYHTLPLAYSMCLRSFPCCYACLLSIVAVTHSVVLSLFFCFFFFFFFVLLNYVAMADVLSAVDLANNIIKLGSFSANAQALIRNLNRVSARVLLAEVRSAEFYLLC